MIVDILHGSRRNPGLLKGQADGAGGLFAALLEADPMVGFAGGTISGDFAIDVRAAGARLFHFLHDEEPRPFGDDEAIAVAGEGS